MAAITVLIGDTQPLFAQALELALRGRCLDLEILEDHPHSGIDVIEAVVTHRPDVAILDYWLEVMQAPAVIRALQVQAPETKVIVLSWLHGRAEIEACLQAGAVGFLTKALDVDKVDEAIHRAYEGESPIFQEELTGYVARFDEREKLIHGVERRLATLTPRELGILRLVGQGLSVDEIGGQLGIKRRTVRNHIQNILYKLDARSQLEAVAMARGGKLIP